MNTLTSDSPDAPQMTLTCPFPKHCEVQPQYVYESNIHSQNLLSTLNEQRKFGLLCDITVIVEGVELLAHKAVLAACSSYFNGIITDPANVSHNIVLELSSISKVGMENLLEFAYTSKLTVSRDNIDHVLSAARELDVKNLEFSCLNLLRQKLFQETSDRSAGPCGDKKNLCRNSTISKKVVSTQKHDEEMKASNEENETSCSEMKDKINAYCTEKPYEKSMISTSGYPLMSQLSLNPKPQIPIQPGLTFSSAPCAEKINPVLLQSAGNVFSTEKTRELYLPHLLQQQICKKSEPVVKMMSVCHSSSDDKIVCQMKQKIPCTRGDPTFTMSCELQDRRQIFAQAYNSDTDEALSADDDADKNFKCQLSSTDASCSKMSRKYPDLALPLSVEEITKLPRSELQELLNKHPNLSMQQISAMHEIRRRGKNRIAAQRCRKRKMDCIRSLQCELEALHKEHNELMNERRSVRENANKLAELFKQRYVEVFNNVLPSDRSVPPSNTPCNANNGKTDGSGMTDQVVASMGKYFQNEAELAGKMADRLKTIPCNNLPPFSWACSMLNSEIVVVCDDDDRSSSVCYKPCSPSVCSTTSFSSDVTESCSLENSTFQDFPCQKVSSMQCTPTISDAAEISPPQEGDDVMITVVSDQNDQGDTSKQISKPPS